MYNSCLKFSPQSWSRIKYHDIWAAETVSREIKQMNKQRICFMAERKLYLLEQNRRYSPQDWGFAAFPASGKREEVTWLVPWRQDCGLRFTFVRLDHAPEVSDLPARFLHSKTSHSHVWEKILLFRTLSLIKYWTIFQRNVTLETIPQLK